MKITAWRFWLCLALLSAIALILQDDSLQKGPVSPEGHRVEVQLSDTGSTWSADFYADVRVVDSHDRKLVEWKDPTGQGNMEGVRKMLESMKWQSPDTLCFYAGGELIELKLPQ